MYSLSTESISPVSICNFTSLIFYLKHAAKLPTAHIDTASTSFFKDLPILP